MKKIRQIVIVLTLLFASYATTAQVAGDLDTTFNTTDLGFGNGDGAISSITTTAIQSDGKIIVGGGFTIYNGTAKGRIARLNSDGTLDASFAIGVGANGVITTITIQPDGKIIIGGQFTTFNGTARSSIARLNTDGTLDTSFTVGTGANGTINATILQPDGKIIVGGDFTTYDGTAKGRVARLNTDGTLDASFALGTGANTAITTTTIQPDGKIIIGGDFTTYDGTAKGRIARLNTDGTLDTSFAIGTGADNSITTITIQSDGKIIIGGFFTTYGGTARSGVARLYTDGTLDTSFVVGTGVNGLVFSTTIQLDGKIIIGGSFTTYNGTAIRSIARLNTDGALDTSFAIGSGPNAALNIAKIQPDGKIIIAGSFSGYNGTIINRIARLNIDGSIDTFFGVGTGANGPITTTTIQPDEKIIIAGQFTAYNGAARGRIARLNTDGTLDTSFSVGTGANGSIFTTAIQSDGKIIIGGGFNNYNGTARNNIARLNTDGSSDTSFAIGTGANDLVYSTTIQPDGKIIVGGDFITFNGAARGRIARLNSDGTLDTSFALGTGADNIITAMTVQPDGKIIIGGNFTSYNGIASGSIARLNTDGTLDISFALGTGANGLINTTTIQQDGKIIIGGQFTTYNGTARRNIARLNTDGTLDISFVVGSGVDSPIYTAAIQSDGKIIIGGAFTTYNGTAIRSIARLNIDGTIDSSFVVGAGADRSINTTAIQPDGKIIVGGYLTGYKGIGRNRIARIYCIDFLNIPDYEILSKIKVYPNPSLGIYNVVLLKTATIEVFDLVGKQMFYKKIQEGTSQLDMSNYSSGIYLLKVTGDNSQSKIVKIIKQ